MTTTWDNGAERYRFATFADLADFATMLADPEVGRWLWFTPAPPGMIEMFFKPFIDTQTRELEQNVVPHTAVFVVEGQDGTFLGQGASLAVAGSPDGFEIGFQLREAAWGRGVGTRLAQFLTAYAVHRCGAYRIEGACLEGNAGSQAILSKLGLGREGARPGYRLRAGERHTEVLYGAVVSDLDSAAIRATAEQFGLV